MAPLQYVSEILSGVQAWPGYVRSMFDRTSVRSLAGTAMALSARDITPCPGYTVTGLSHSANSITANLQLAGTACNVNGTDLNSLQLLVEYQTDSRLHVKIYDSDEQVYQIPTEFLDLPSGSQSSSHKSLLSFSYTEKPFTFAVQRSDTKETLFNTSGNPLIFESQYVYLRTSLPTDPYIYGLGEDSDPFRRPTDDYTRTLWNTGVSFLPVNSNLYGSHPVYLEMRDGQAHGVFLANSDGMDIKIAKTDQGEQYLAYNINGGVLDLFFLAGPTPSEVSQQYAGIVGTPAEQAYWTYGFHQCKYGYQDVMMVADVVYNYSQANIPLEVMWTDIDYMDGRRTWTLDPERFPLEKMQELVTYLHDRNQSYIMMVDPPVSVNDSTSYNRGLQDDVFFKNSDGSVYLGGMWPGVTTWVDWLHPNAQDFWTAEVASFFNAETGVDVDAIWIDMNEPANFCPFPCTDPFQWVVGSGDPPAPPPVRTTWPPLPGFPPDFQPPGSSLDKRQSKGNRTGLPGRDLLNPPYAIGNIEGPLYSNSINTDLITTGGYAVYDIHNLFASGMQAATRSALLTRRPGLRPLIISRSTFAGSGKKSGHWTGDNASLWTHYRISIWQNMEFASIFQIPTVGADVCGFNDATYDLLCARWATLGAFYPFYRNHADISAPFQEFYRWPIVAEAAREAIKRRFQLLDYFYTEFHYQTVDGTPSTILPLFFIYPGDTNALDIDLQFFFGPSLLVSPVTDENSTSVTFYLPKDTFYDFFTGEQVQGQGENVTRNNVSFTEIPVHIRGGSIIPMRVDGANNTRLLRELDFELVIAPDADGKASGRLYLDDGESVSPSSWSEITFEYDSKTRSAVVGGSFGYQTNSKIARVTLLGEKDSSNTQAGSIGKVVQVDKPLTSKFTIAIA